MEGWCRSKVSTLRNISHEYRAEGSDGMQNRTLRAFHAAIFLHERNLRMVHARDVEVQSVPSAKVLCIASLCFAMICTIILWAHLFQINILKLPQLALMWYDYAYPTSCRRARNSDFRRLRSPCRRQASFHDPNHLDQRIRFCSCEVS